MKTLFLSDKIPWFGNHTGYELLPAYIANAGLAVSVVQPKSNLSARLIGKLYQIYNKMPPGNTYNACSELIFSIKASRNDLKHVLYIENHLDCFMNKPDSRNLIGTIHLPPSKWTPDMLQSLRSFSSAIILYRKDISFFEEYAGKGNISFIRYGVDTDFFVPLKECHPPRRALAAGHYLRNTRMLHAVITRLAPVIPDLRFDILVPQKFRDLPGYSDLADNAQVTWHQNLNDLELRSLYQNSYLLLLPMENSGASTAVVEALACGLPIVTTDVGGIRDYGGGSVYPIVANNDDDAMLGLVEKYLNDVDWRNEIAANCRKFAEQNLAWPIIAEKHIDAYGALGLAKNGSS